MTTEYVTAYYWLFRRGIIVHAIGCNCISCAAAITRYYS